MQKEEIILAGKTVEIFKIAHLIIGSGCSGLNAADCLFDLGERDIALITEGMNMGTSRNTGSDKQTYYKLSIAADEKDSIRDLARTLFDGGGIDGDIALVQAACSVRCFMKLCEKGVHFPTNEYGEYIGYKTDHDPRERATSAGPLTSKYMTEVLESSVKSKGIRIFDQCQVVQLIVKDNVIKGVLGLDKKALEEGRVEYKLFNCETVILATGGPANIYYTSVYPESQTGATALAIEVGAKLANLSEWQYGISSTKFRWNVSGTYQQVLPRYISVDNEGNEREFLLDYFDSTEDMLNLIFLKGYQWPFDVKKIKGSSIIDILVHREIFEKKRHVFLDFTKNPTGLEVGFEKLSKEAYNYLSNSEALLGTPIQRLEKMNPKAIELYASHGIDLYTEALEIAVCAQHHNGGVEVDNHWQSSIEGLYVVGEAAGTFGIYRPGGSALNATQVSGLRVAEHIAYSRKKEGERPSIKEIAKTVEEFIKKVEKVLTTKGEQSNLNERIIYYQKLMSEYGAHIRSKEKLLKLHSVVNKAYEYWFDEVEIGAEEEVSNVIKGREMLLTQLVVISSMIKCMETTGSRGSALILNGKDEYKFNDILCMDKVLVTQYSKAKIENYFREVNPLPVQKDWFENTWREYNKRLGIQSRK